MAEPRSERSSATAQFVEAVLFLPIGLGATVITEAPSTYRRVRSDLTAARFLGQLAVTRGLAELRARRAGAEEGDVPPGRDAPAEQASGTDTDTGTDSGTTTAAGAGTGDSTEHDPGSGTDDPAPPAPVPEVSELAIVNYDSVPAIDIVAQLGDLDDDERAQLEAYERAHRARRTVLGKLAQLRAAS